MTDVHEVPILTMKCVSSGNKACNQLYLLLASNRIRKEIIQSEHGDSKIILYGNSFRAVAGDKEEAVLVAKFDIDKSKYKRPSLGIF
ncbi:hypothetical protein MANES_11G162650v8 [Manihot esculenta]|uniref:Uncharacterized protein n=1 Tax=Manihot esculenta TaxID=3983 RepID=A0ACB7GWS3_MANES|nr:hypothetical protein MANES_11G162650v8 [Manihot esculenta]